MATVEITVLIAVIGCFVGLAGWLAGRDKRIARDSEWRGSVDAKLDAIIGIREDVKEIGDKVDAQGERITAVEQSAKQAHHRISEHLAKER
ncbi:MAG: hypothetical protein VB082_03025 [Christensenella sp.]|nr:hypothetical protein [Christensenella sp.]